jgi:hypothetical protein
MNLIDKIKKMFGYTYVVNLNTWEIHNLKNKHENCKIYLMTNKKLITKKQLKSYLDDGYNGCRWCLKEFNVE